MEVITHLPFSPCQGQESASPAAEPTGAAADRAGIAAAPRMLPMPPSPLRMCCRQAAGEGAQGAAALKKEEEQREEENAKLAQWVDLLFKCS